MSSPAELVKRVQELKVDVDKAYEAAAFLSEDFKTLLPLKLNLARCLVSQHNDKIDVDKLRWDTPIEGDKIEFGTSLFLLLMDDKHVYGSLNRGRNRELVWISDYSLPANVLQEVLDKMTQLSSLEDEAEAEPDAMLQGKFVWELVPTFLKKNNPKTEVVLFKGLEIIGFINRHDVCGYTWVQQCPHSLSPEAIDCITAKLKELKGK